MTTKARVIGPTQGDAIHRAVQAFQHLAPLTPDYALCPIAAGFNWADCLAGLDEGRWYLVVFRSLRRVTADVALLTAFDDQAYDEAQAAAGLLYYFKGVLNPARACLSFCLWASQRHAQQAAALPRHRAAMRLVDQMYDSYVLERYVVRKQRGVPQPQIVAVAD